MRQNAALCGNGLMLSKTSPCGLQCSSFENTVGKVEIARNGQFVL